MHKTQLKNGFLLFSYNVFSMTYSIFEMTDSVILRNLLSSLLTINYIRTFTAFKEV